MRLDSHQHFWKYNPKKHGWINEDMKVIQKNFLPDDLIPLLSQHQLDGCIAVQADESFHETAFLLDLAEEHKEIKHKLVELINNEYLNEFKNDLLNESSKNCKSYFNNLSFIIQKLLNSCSTK